MTQAELILELRDIQPPPAPPWWLLAPESVLLLLLLMSVAIALALYIRRRKSKHLFIAALTELDLIKTQFQLRDDQHQLALALSKWFKKVALLAFPDQQLSGLTGSDWLVFLDGCIGDRSFTQGCGAIFGGAVYQRVVNFDKNAVYSLCQSWLKSIEPQLLHQGRARC